MTNFRFLRPLKDREALYLGLLIGYRKGNVLNVNKLGQTIGCKVDLKDEKEVIDWAYKQDYLLPILN